MLAARRLRPLWFITAATFGVIFGAVYAVRGPLAERAAATAHEAGRARAIERDTAVLAARLHAADSTLAIRDAAWRSAQFQAERAAATVAVLTVEQQHERDSLGMVSTQLAAALDRAAKAPLPSSYRALADTRALQTLGAVQVLIDSLDLLERARQALDPMEAPQSEFAQLSQRANAIGSSLQAIGQTRLSAIARQLAAIATPAPTGTVDADTTRARAQMDTARWDVAHAESLLRDARQWHVATQARADSVAHARAEQMLGASPAITAVSALLMALVFAFTLAVLIEARTPTIGHAREAERLTGVPVLGVAGRFRVPREGRARLQSGVGVDPFRMAYLTLTASGVKERVVCVTGDEATTTIAVACRLAVSAAADERATLLVDLAPGVPGASAFLGWKDEPGFTEAIAGIRLWREVARPVGASEGLSLEVIPAGSPRQDTETSVHDDSARAELSRFLAEYDVIVLVAPNAAAVEHAVTVSGHPLTLVTARVASTRLQRLGENIERLRERGARVHGILLVDYK